MPALGKGQFQKGRTAQLRARFHDFNSTRRHRGQSTTTWEKYKENTNNGTVQFTTKKSKK